MKCFGSYSVSYVIFLSRFSLKWKLLKNTYWLVLLLLCILRSSIIKRNTHTPELGKESDLWAAVGWRWPFVRHPVLHCRTRLVQTFGQIWPCQLWSSSGCQRWGPCLAQLLRALLSSAFVWWMWHNSSVQRTSIRKPSALLLQYPV